MDVFAFQCHDSPIFLYIIKFKKSTSYINYIFPRLCSAVDELEMRCEELQVKAEEAKASERRSKEKKKNWSFPNLPEALALDLRKNFYNDSLGWTYVDQFRSLPQNPYEVEIRRSQEMIRNMRSQVTVERKKNGELEEVIGNLERENQSLESKNRELEQKITEAKEREVYFEVVQSKYEQLCKIFGSDAGLSHKRGIIESDVEHDDPQVSSEGRYAKLGDGGSVYGSSESISKVVSETGEMAPSANSEGENVEGGVSILNEISAQYTALIQQYEELLTTLSKRPDEESRASKVVVAKLHKEVQTLFNLSLQKTVPKTDTATSPIESVPTYKALFKDIFATLKKSQIEEEKENQDEDALPGSSVVARSKSADTFASTTSGATQSKDKGGLTKKRASSKPALNK